MPSLVMTTFRTTPEQKSRLDFLAKETHRTASFYLNLLLEEHIDELENIYLKAEKEAQKKAIELRNKGEQPKEN